MSEKQERHIIDEVGPFEFLTELINFHGAKRAAELIGQSVIWGMHGLKTKSEVISFCQSKGYSHMTAYRLVWDFEQFFRHLEDVHGWHGTLEEGIGEIRLLAA
jgi:hypothetical protein